MNVPIMSMDPRIAAVHYRDYRKKVREHKVNRVKELEARARKAGQELGRIRIEKSLLEKEDEVLMASYREMARGQRLVNIAAAITNAGLDSKKQLPVLAIAMADWKYALLRHDHGFIVFTEKRWPDWSWRKEKFTSPSVAIPQGMFKAELTNAEWRKGRDLPNINNAKAVVPSIPAHLRPAGDLSKYHILWEAVWDTSPPVDPLLLRHVGGFIYSVVAQWDLTPVERSVLEGRLG